MNMLLWHNMLCRHGILKLSFRSSFYNKMKRVQLVALLCDVWWLIAVEYCSPRLSVMLSQNFLENKQDLPESTSSCARYRLICQSIVIVTDVLISSNPVHVMFILDISLSLSLFSISLHQYCMESHYWHATSPGITGIPQLQMQWPNATVSFLLKSCKAMLHSKARRPDSGSFRNSLLQRPCFLRKACRWDLDRNIPHITNITHRNIPDLPTQADISGKCDRDFSVHNFLFFHFLIISVLLATCDFLSPQLFFLLAILMLFCSFFRWWRLKSLTALIFDWIFFNQM